MVHQGKRLVVVDYRHHPKGHVWPTKGTYNNSVRLLVWAFVQLHYDPREHPIVRAKWIGSIDDDKGLVEQEMKGRYVAALIVRRKYDPNKGEHPWALEKINGVWKGKGEPPAEALVASSPTRQ